MTARFLLAAGLALGANAHLFISSPVPIEGNGVKPPLDPSGSDFPCHGVQLPTTGGQKMAAGSSQVLSFDLGGGANTAVHGGGSCQLSYTTETDAAKVKDPKNWRVIYSILGGCPTDAPGNLAQAIACSGGDLGQCVQSYNYTIPKGVASGHAILAWTWFNTIGNREMYMDCSNVEFTDGDGSEVDSFPEMFVANIASVNSCQTVEQTNVQFPNPGKHVLNNNKGSPYKLAIPTGAGCSSDGGSNSGSGSAPAISGYGGTGAATPSSTAAPAISGYGGNGASAPAAPTSQAPAAPAPSGEVAPAPVLTSTAAPVASTAPSAPSGSCPTGEHSCPTAGELVCIDSTHFGICDIDGCAVSQAVASGTQCKDGKISKRDITKRDVKQRRRKHGHYLY